MAVDELEMLSQHAMEEHDAFCRKIFTENFL